MVLHSVLLVLSLLHSTDCALEVNETRLHRELFQGYNKHAHPRLPGTGPVTVMFDFQLIRILDVSARDQFINTYAWVNQYWTNNLLQWNPEDYGGVEEIHVSPESVWVPDTLLYNNIDEEERIGGGRTTYTTNVAVRYDGSNTWLNPAMFKSICGVDITNFPFDDQECLLKFGSWSFDMSKIDLTVRNDTILNKYYIRNGEWKLLNISVKRNALKYQCCPHAFVDVSVRVRIRRESLDYILKLIIPCSLISSMIFLGFVLPPESGERIGLSITVLLAMTVFQQLSSELMPSYGFPLLGQYYFACMIEIGTSLVVTTLILNFYHRNSRRMPKTLRILILYWLARIVFPRKSSKEWNLELSTREAATASFRRSSNQGEDQALGSEDITLLGDSLSEHSMRDSKSSSCRYSDPWIPMRSLSYGFGLPVSGIAHNNNIRCQSCYMENGSRTQRTDCKGKSKFYNSSNKTKRKSSTHCKCPRRSSIVTNQRASTISTSVVVDLLPENADISQEKLKNQKEWVKAARVLDRLFLIVSILIGVTTLFALFLKAPRFH